MIGEFFSLKYDGSFRHREERIKAVGETDAALIRPSIGLGRCARSLG